MRCIWLAIPVLLTLSGCTGHTAGQRAAEMEPALARNGFSPLDVETKHFTLRAWRGPSAQSAAMHVYIEGDGFAWATRYQPSQNPTPFDPMAARLAMLDTQVNTAYLARPCQYVDLKLRPCGREYWTASRFSQEVIDSMSEAVSRLKHMARANRIVLIGYSGGGAIAALVAAQRTDVSQVITVAGNLDIRAWTRLHGISGLAGSLNPADYWKPLAGVRQTHYIGERDAVMPPEIYDSYRKAFPASANITMEILAGFDHKCCWVQAWPQLLAKAVAN